MQKGSRFTMLLPLRLGNQVKTDSRPVIQSVDFARYRVLIAEDNLLNQEIVDLMLEETGINRRIVDNGEQAVDAAREFQPDIILMDIQMPVMNGLDACRIISEERPGTPIVALTANVMKDDIAEYKQTGFVAHLGKPYEEAELLSVMQRHLSNSSIA